MPAALQALAEGGLPLGKLVTLARRRVVAHAKIEADRIGPTLLAALLGRGIHGMGSESVASYWATWVTGYGGSSRGTRRVRRMVRAG